MHWQYTPYVLLLLVAAAISVVLALYVWQRRPVPGAMPFVLLMLAVAEWQLGYALELGSADLPTKVLWARVQYLGIVIVPTAWLAFVLQYTGRGKWLTRRNVAILAIEPLVTLLLAWTNASHGLIFNNIELYISGSSSRLNATLGAWGWIDVAYSYVLIMLGIFLLIQALVRLPRLYRQQIVVVLACTFAPWAAEVLSLSGLSPLPHLDLTPFALSLSGLVITWGLFRFRLLDVVPVARDAIIKSMSDGVIVLDAQDRVVDLNSAAERIIGRTASEVVGQPASKAFSGCPYLAEHHCDVTGANTEIVLGEGEAQCIYDLRISPLNDRPDRFTGCLVILRDITERKRAEVMLRIREQYLECLAEVSQILIRTETLAQALPKALRCLGETAGVSRVYLFENRLGPQGGLLCSQRCEWCAPGVEPQIDNPDLQNFPWVAGGFARWMEILGQGGIIAGNVADFPESERVVLESQDIRSVLVIPLFVSDAWHGFIGFDACDRVREWQQVEVDLLQAAASVIASGIEREQARRRERALAEAVAALTATLDFEQVLDRILEQVGRVVPSDAANVMLIEGDRARVVRWRGYERFGAEEFVSTVVFRIPEVPNLQHMVDTKEPIIISDTATYPGWVHVPVQEWLRSYAAAPIVVRDEVVGFLNVDSAIPGFFSQAHLGPLCAFADHAAVAIENARLFDSLTREKNHLELLYGVARALSESLNLEEVTERALCQTCAAVGAFKGILLLLEPGTDRLHLVAASGYEAESVEALDRRIGLRIGHGLAGWVAAQRRTAIVADVRQDEHWLTVDGLDDWVCSALVVPLMVHDRLVGVLSLYSECCDAFDEAQRRLVEAVAVPVAIAIQNAQLFQAEQRQTRRLALLVDIARIVATTLDADDLLQAVAESIHRYFARPVVEVFTLDDEGRTLLLRGYSGIVPIGSPGIAAPGVYRQPIEQGIIGHVARTGKPYYASDVRSDPYFLPVGEIPLRSELCVPILDEGRVVGAVDVESDRLADFDEGDQSLLEAVADTIAVGLRNARLYEEIQLRADGLGAALVRLEELDRLKSQFIQNVSHELRTPLALIRGYAEMLDAGELGELRPEQQKPVSVIARRARMLSDLVEDITLILEAESSPPQPAPVALDELARAAVEDFQGAVRQAGLRLHAEIAPHLPPVSGSLAYLRRVLDNLIDNAVKFTPAGGTITMRLRQEGEQVALEVSDTGIGIPADQLERIFERFYQVDGGTQRQYGGVGLGLALVKEIVEAYGGRVTVESRVGEGSTFTVLLPIATNASAEGDTESQ